MIYLVDASVFVFRSWHALPDSMVDSEGRPVHAVYGYARFLCELLDEAGPTHAAVAFDESLTTSFRNEIYPPYKAHRPPPPPDIAYQFVRCQEFTRAMGVAAFSSDRYEADDLVGTLAAMAHRQKQPVSIVTGDKDLAQLLERGDYFVDPGRDKRLGYDDIPGEFGVRPEQIADFLALTGDSVDNIPGVPGIGKKTAAALLAHFDDLTAIYADLDSVAGTGIRGVPRVLGALREYEEQLFLAQRLTRIALDAPIGSGLASIRRSPPRLDELSELCSQLRFGGGVRAQVERIADAFAESRAPQQSMLFPEPSSGDAG